MGTTKERYIELHGIDAWEKEAEKRSQRFKRWIEKNAEKKLQYDKEYHEAHKERQNELARKNGVTYRKNNKEKLAKKQREYRRTSKIAKSYSLYKNYKRDDTMRNRPTEQNIDAKWIIENIFNSSCVYCGDDDWTHLGADRIDNSKPHTPDNVVCACGICNMDRSDKYSVEEFKEYRQTHPRSLDVDEKSWEIVEMEGIKVIKKKQI